MYNENFERLVLEKLDSFQVEMKEMKSEITGINSEITGIKFEIDEIKYELLKINNKTDRMETKLNAVFEQTAILTEFKTEVIHRLNG